MEYERHANTRVGYLDDLRGFAALAVLLTHSLLIFGETLATIPDEVGALIGLPVKAIALAANGNAAVCVFFILSGYVMADFGLSTRLGLPAQLARRYIRLVIPILLTSTFAYLLLRYDLFWNTESARIYGGWAGMWYHFPASVTAMSYEALIGTFAKGSNAYNSNLWTMRPELLGSFYVLLICAAARDKMWRTVFYICLCAYYVLDYPPLFAIGALLREHNGLVRRIAARRWMPLACCAAGAYLCTVPEVVPGSWLARLYPLPHFSFDNTRYWHSIGATLLLIGLLNSPILQKWFGAALGRWLGRISFTLYLIHVPLLCSFSAWLIVSLSPYGLALSASIGLLLTIPVCLGFAAILSPVVDGGAVKLSREIGRLDGLINRVVGIVRDIAGANATSASARIVMAPDVNFAATSAAVAKQD